MKLSLSVFIIAFNEADRIGATLSSVKDWVQEIIVIDSGSSDGTQKIATGMGARVIHNAWHGYGPQKRFGEEQCRNDWVLNLDADEVVSDALRQEILSLFVDGVPALDGYTLHMVEVLPGERKPSRFAHTISAVRLYSMKMGRYAESTVHDRVHFSSDAQLGALKGPVLHFSSRGLEHSVGKLNRYSTMQAQERIERMGSVPLLTLKLLTIFPAAFLKAYLLRGYALRGLPGFVNATVFAFSRFLRLAKMQEMLRK